MPSQRTVCQCPPKDLGPVGAGCMLQGRRVESCYRNTTPAFTTASDWSIVAHNTLVSAEVTHNLCRLDHQATLRHIDAVQELADVQDPAFKSRWASKSILMCELL